MPKSINRAANWSKNYTSILGFLSELSTDAWDKPRYFIPCNGMNVCLRESNSCALFLDIDLLKTHSCLLSIGESSYKLDRAFYFAWALGYLEEFRDRQYNLTYIGCMNEEMQFAGCVIVISLKDETNEKIIMAQLEEGEEEDELEENDMDDEYGRIINACKRRKSQRQDSKTEQYNIRVQLKNALNGIVETKSANRSSVLKHQEQNINGVHIIDTIVGSHRQNTIRPSNLLQFPILTERVLCGHLDDLNIGSDLSSAYGLSLALKMAEDFCGLSFAGDIINCELNNGIYDNGRWFVMNSDSVPSYPNIMTLMLPRNYEPTMPEDEIIRCYNMLYQQSRAKHFLVQEHHIPNIVSYAFSNMFNEMQESDEFMETDERNVLLFIPSKTVFFVETDKFAKNRADIVTQFHVDSRLSEVYNTDETKLQMSRLFLHLEQETNIAPALCAIFDILKNFKHEIYLPKIINANKWFWSTAALKGHYGDVVNHAYAAMISYFTCGTEWITFQCMWGPTSAGKNVILESIKAVLEEFNTTTDATATVMQEWGKHHGFSVYNLPEIGSNFTPASENNRTSNYSITDFKKFLNNLYDNDSTARTRANERASVSTKSAMRPFVQALFGTNNFELIETSIRDRMLLNSMAAHRFYDSIDAEKTHFSKDERISVWKQYYNEIRFLACICRLYCLLLSTRILPPIDTTIIDSLNWKTIEHTITKVTTNRITSTQRTYDNIIHQIKNTAVARTVIETMSFGESVTVTNEELHEQLISVLLPISERSVVTLQDVMSTISAFKCSTYSYTGLLMLTSLRELGVKARVDFSPTDSDRITFTCPEVVSLEPGEFTTILKETIGRQYTPAQVTYHLDELKHVRMANDTRPVLITRLYENGTGKFTVASDCFRYVAPKEATSLASMLVQTMVIPIPEDLWSVVEFEVTSALEMFPPKLRSIFKFSKKGIAYVTMEGYFKLYETLEIPCKELFSYYEKKQSKTSFLFSMDIKRDIPFNQDNAIISQKHIHHPIVGPLLKRMMWPVADESIDKLHLLHNDEILCRNTSPCVCFSGVYISILRTFPKLYETFKKTKDIPMSLHSVLACHYERFHHITNSVFIQQIHTYNSINGKAAFGKNSTAIDTTRCGGSYPVITANGDVLDRIFQDLHEPYDRILRSIIGATDAPEEIVFNQESPFNPLVPMSLIYDSDVSKRSIELNPSNLLSSDHSCVFSVKEIVERRVATHFPSVYEESSQN